VNISTEQIVQERVDPFSDFHHPFMNDDFFNDFFDSFPSRDVTRQTLGSGVIISDEGYVLTNNHVISQASKITVALPGGQEFAGVLVGGDPNIDLAIVKIDAGDALPSVTLGDSDSLMIGETVIAIGNPFGLEHTVTTGVLSARNRSIKGGDGRVYNNFLQTDASINPGNSGGPLINIDGEVIGINTAIYAQAEGIGFAIPINRCKRVIADLIEYGEVKQAWVGVRAQELTGKLAGVFKFTGDYGVLVSDVLADDPDGFKRGDIVTQINGTAVHSVEEFYDKLSGLLVDESMPVSVFRDGGARTINVMGRELPLDDALDIADQWFGVEVEEVTLDVARRLRIGAAGGVLVAGVRGDSLAQRVGLRADDIIHQFGAVPVKTINDFKKAVILASERPTAAILVQRGRMFYNSTIDLTQ
jgi:Do/DeqQ family serine protease